MIDQPINMRQSLDVDLNKFLLHSKNLLLDLSKSDIRINNSCRFSVFINKMENFMKAISKSDILIKGEEIALLAEGIRDFFEMNVIVKSERVRYDGKKDLQKLFSGSSFPSGDSLQSPRSLQFQLYLAALMDLSGFDIKLKEPDFFFQYKGHKYSVAAKRINSPSKIYARLSEAKKQIKNYDDLGFIALSIDRVVWDEMNKDTYIITKNPDVLYSAGETIFYDVLKNKFKKAVLDNLDPHVVGHIVSLTVPALIPELYSIGVLHNIKFIPFVEPDNIIYEDTKEMSQKLKWPSYT